MVAPRKIVFRSDVLREIENHFSRLENRIGRIVDIKEIKLEKKQLIKKIKELSDFDLLGRK